MNKAALIAWIEARLSERSTYLGLIGLLTDCGVHVAPALAGWVATIGVAIVGGILVFTKDHKPAEALTTVVTEVVDELEAEQAANSVANSTTVTQA